METKLVQLPAIAVIGKQGLCTKEHNVVAELWQEANTHFSEVEPIAMREKNGSLVGFWGAMSDETMSFLPWADGYSRGLYLAGVEVYQDTPVPEGWTKWILPARTWLVADVLPGTYGEVFTQVIRQEIPRQGFRLSGAACDFTDPATGMNKLFFPVEKAEN